MELRVESAEGFRLPNDCYVGIRVGDVLKQGRYEPQRCYHFPRVDRQRNAKIDVYQHIGSCVVAIDPDTKAQHEVSVSSADPSVPSTKLLVNVQTRNDDSSSKQQRDERTKALKNQAREYLSKHSIEERLSEAVKALLKEQPDDPTEFLCNHLGGTPPSKAGQAGKVDASAKNAEAKTAGKRDINATRAKEPETVSDGSTEAIRTKASQLLTDAANSGALEKALHEELGRDSKAAVRVKAADLLTKAAENGDLERALNEVMRPSAEQSSDERIRQRAAQVLTGAAEDGRLDQALLELNGSSTTKPSSLDSTRAKAAQVLMQAAENGTLESVLAETRGETGNKEGSADVAGVRDKAARALLEAADNGSLESAISDIAETRKPKDGQAVHKEGAQNPEKQGESNKDQPKQPKKNVEEVRQKASNLLMKAADNGDLEKVLREVNMKSTKAEDSGPPIVMNSMAMGPAYNTMGLQPGLLFI